MEFDQVAEEMDLGVLMIWSLKVSSQCTEAVRELPMYSMLINLEALLRLISCYFCTSARCILTWGTLFMHGQHLYRRTRTLFVWRMFTCE